MPTSVYGQILQGVRAILEALPGFQGGDGELYSRRPVISVLEEPAWPALRGSFPAVIVAPRADLTETLIEYHGTGTEPGRGGFLRLGYEVYVGLFTDRRPNDAGLLEYRLARREEVHWALHKPKVLHLAVPVTWNVLYEPRPAVSARGEAPANGVASWQLFTFVTRESGPV